MSGENYVGSEIDLFLRGQRAWVMKPRDVIHHEHAHAFDTVCGGLGDIAFPVYVIPIILRQRLHKEPVFSEARPPERVIVVQPEAKAIWATSATVSAA